MKKLLVISILTFSSICFGMQKEEERPLPVAASQEVVPVAPAGPLVVPSKVAYEASLKNIQTNVPLIVEKSQGLLPTVRQIAQECGKGYVQAGIALICTALDANIRNALYSLIGLLNVTYNDLLMLKHADVATKDKAVDALHVLATEPSIRGLLEYSVTVPYVGKTLQGNLQEVLTSIVQLAQPQRKLQVNP